MNFKTFVSYGLTVAAVCLGSPAFADVLPKSGTYSAHFGWVFKGDVQELGASRSVSTGMVNGVIFNDAGKGFLHKVRADCTLMNDVKEGRANADGTCVMTDADGDKIFLEWKCTG